MLGTNLIPNQLRYQLEFGDLPARAETISEKDWDLLFGIMGSGRPVGSTCFNSRQCGKNKRCSKGTTLIKTKFTEKTTFFPEPDSSVILLAWKLPKKKGTRETGENIRRCYKVRGN